MNVDESQPASLAGIWILGLNLLIACAAQIAATLALVQGLADAAQR